jgi:type IX secretion system PorP/SprF family membrane protein
MKNNRRHICFFKGLLLAFSILNFQFLIGQDIHFSNWQMSPLNLNPAQTGIFEGDGRLIFNYRTQWKSVQVPYNTFSFGGDFNLNKSLIKGTSEALGFIFNHDVSGDGKYTITDFKVPFNHKFSFRKDSGLTIAFGILAGVSNVKMDPNRLSYDSQWDGDAYNGNIQNGENFNLLSKVYADVALGTVVQKQFNQKWLAAFGYGISHINQPNISFYNTKGVTLKPRHNESLQLKFSFNNISSVMLEYYGNQQQKFRENLAGLSYYYTIQPKTGTTVNIGFFNRMGDAVITTLGLQHNHMRLQGSYDYNYSAFKRATNGKGAFELSFIYIYAKPKVFVPKTRVCPIYM